MNSIAEMSSYLKSWMPSAGSESVSSKTAESTKPIFKTLGQLNPSTRAELTKAKETHELLSGAAGASLFVLAVAFIVMAAGSMAVGPLGWALLATAALLTVSSVGAMCDRYISMKQAGLETSFRSVLNDGFRAGAVGFGAIPYAILSSPFIFFIGF